MGKIKGEGQARRATYMHTFRQTLSGVGRQHILYNTENHEQYSPAKQAGRQARLCVVLVAGWGVGARNQSSVCLYGWETSLHSSLACSLGLLLLLRLVLLLLVLCFLIFVLGLNKNTTNQLLGCKKAQLREFLLYQY